MFRALLAHPQEALHKPHLVHCVRDWSSTSILVHPTDITCTQCTKCRLWSTSWGWASNTWNMQRPLIVDKLNKKCITLVSLYWYTVMHGRQNIKPNMMNTPKLIPVLTFPTLFSLWTPLLCQCTSKTASQHTVVESAVFAVKCSRRKFTYISAQDTDTEHRMILRMNWGEKKSARSGIKIGKRTKANRGKRTWCMHIPLQINNFHFILLTDCKCFPLLDVLV
jgi:hypothetical protein